MLWNHLEQSILYSTFHRHPCVMDSPFIPTACGDESFLPRHCTELYGSNLFEPRQRSGKPRGQVLYNPSSQCMPVIPQNLIWHWETWILDPQLTKIQLARLNPSLIPHQGAIRGSTTHVTIQLFDQSNAKSFNHNWYMSMHLIQMLCWFHDFLWEDNVSV